MKFAQTNCFLKDHGSPERDLRLLAEAGFQYFFWCYHWNDDYLYSLHEMKAYKKMMDDSGIKLLDIHGTSGQEKCFFSTVEYARKAGVELVVNRMIMHGEMGAEGDLTLHVPYFQAEMNEEERKTVVPEADALKRSLDELMPSLEKYNVRLALENGQGLSGDTFEILGDCMKSYPAERLGITFDSGHANRFRQLGFSKIEAFLDRVYVLHLHDNDGIWDWHRPPADGIIDWKKLLQLVARTPAGKKPLCFEVQMNHTPFFDKELGEDQPMEKIREFLAYTFEKCRKTAELYEKVK